MIDQYEPFLTTIITIIINQYDDHYPLTSINRSFLTTIIMDHTDDSHDHTS